MSKIKTRQNTGYARSRRNTLARPTMVDMAAAKHQATTQESPLDGSDGSWQRLDVARRSRRRSRRRHPRIRAEADSDTLPVSTEDDEESTLASADRHDEEGCDDDGDDNEGAAPADDGDGTPEEEEEETAGKDNSDSDVREDA